MINGQQHQPEPRFRPVNPPLQWPWAEARAQVHDHYAVLFSDGPVEWRGVFISRRMREQLEALEAACSVD